MAILEIKKYPDPILRKRAEEIKKITPEIRSLGEMMIKTMLEAPGVGLAGPQVGLSQKIIVVHLVKERSPGDKTEALPQIFINPKIIKKSRETAVEEEGCLSIPRPWLKIKRAKEVLVEALDIEGRPVQIEAKDLPARIFQHEIDHINGILIIDRVNFLQRLKFRINPVKFK
jgi:peptide deformylase